MYMFRKSIICFLVITMAMVYCNIGMLASNAEAGTVFYVNPSSGNDNNTGLTMQNAFKTIKKAQSAVRSFNTGMKADINVILAGGTYPITESLTFTPADSGQNGFRVVYKNAAGQIPVLDGGMEVKGWDLYDQGKRIYRASVNPGTQFRQLYINGVRAIRARMPNYGSNSVNGCLTGASITASQPWRPVVDASVLKGMTLSEGMEMVLESHWMERRVHPIAFSSPSDGKVTLTLRPEEENYKIMNHENQRSIPFYFENSLSFLDQPGEWFLDSKTGYVYMIPPTGINPSSIKIVAPQVESIIRIFGESSQRMVHDIVFEGMTLVNTNFVKPDTMGYINNQAGVALANTNVSYYSVPGAVILHNTNKIELSGLNISNAGAHGIVADYDVVSNTYIHGCQIQMTAGGGIYLNLLSPASKSNVISNNKIKNIGIDYTDIVGIFVMKAPGTSITNNTVKLAPYTGISIGWQWDDLDSVARDIIVSGNLISNVMLLHDDGGGIYTLGKIPGCRIEKNYISYLTPSNIQGGYPIAAIYLDNGSSQKVIDSNIIEYCKLAVTAKNKPVHDNTLVNNFYDGDFMDDVSQNTLIDNRKVTDVYVDKLITSGSYKFGAS